MQIFENRPKGFGAGRPRNMAFLIDFAGRPYNTLTVPCERVIFNTLALYKAT